MDGQTVTTATAKRATGHRNFSCYFLYIYFQGNLSFGIRRGSKKKKFFSNVFEGIAYHPYYLYQPLKVYYAVRGKFCAFRLEYYGSLESIPPLSGTVDARFQSRTRFNMSLQALARYSIYKAKTRSVLARMLTFTDECDSITYTRDYFLPALSNTMTQYQTPSTLRTPETDLPNFVIGYRGSLDRIDWSSLRVMFDSVRTTSPFEQWKKKEAMKEILRCMITTRTHVNNMGILRYISYGLLTVRPDIRYCIFDNCSSPDSSDPD